MKADKDLGSQQHHLATTDYDLRITNLAGFIYSKLVGRHPELNSGSNGMPKQVRHDVRLKPKLLDVGAGNGLFLKFFKNKGFEVAGYELEMELVENIKKDPRLKEIDVRQGDITKMTGNETYDVVIASDVIEHIEDDNKAIANLWSFVKPGGRLFITVPAHLHLYGKRDKAWGHYRRYDKSVLKKRIIESISRRHPELVSGSGEMPKQVRHDEYYEIETLTFWNIVGYFIYFLYEKILHKQINEEMRYSKSFISKFVLAVLDSILKIENMIGGLPLGLTLVAVVKKVK